MQYNFNEHCHTSPMLDEILHMEIRRVRRSVEEHFILFFPHRERKKKLIKKKKNLSWPAVHFLLALTSVDLWII